MKFASWTYDGFQINLVQPSDEADLSNYVPNGEWELIGLEVKRNVVYYSCCVEPYPDLTYSMRLRRRPLFYIFNFVLPCVLITAIALLGFYMPSDSGEKVTLGITTLLSMTVFMMLVAESMPPTSEELPLIGIYYGVTIIIVSLATGMTVFTLNLHHKGYRGKEMHPWLKRLAFDYLAKILFLNFKQSYPKAKKSEQKCSTPTSKSPRSFGCNRTRDSYTNSINYADPVGDRLQLATYPNFYFRYDNSLPSPADDHSFRQKHDMTSPVPLSRDTTTTRLCHVNHCNDPANQNDDVAEMAAALVEKRNRQRLAAEYHTVTPLDQVNYYYGDGSTSPMIGSDSNERTKLDPVGADELNETDLYRTGTEYGLRRRILGSLLSDERSAPRGYDTLLSNGSTWAGGGGISATSAVAERETAKNRRLIEGKDRDSADRSVENKLMFVLERIRSIIDKTEGRMADQDAKDKVREEWMQLAIVMDRILLIVFVLVTVLVSFFIIYSSPYSKLRRYLESTKMSNKSFEG